MARLVDVRHGRVRHTPVVAASAAFLLVAGGAWVSWQWVQGDAPTLLRSEFEEWLTWLAVGAALVALLGVLFWRARNVRVGIVAGLALAALAVVFGLVVDIITLLPSRAMPATRTTPRRPVMPLSVGSVRPCS